MKTQIKEEGLLFNKFDIIECLKKDDNSSVFLATNIHTKKKVVLKILNTINLADDSILERFKREAKVLANIEHPNIIKVLDYGTDSNNYYTSFEYFESSNLRSIIRENKLSYEEKKKLVIQLFTGLDFAHKNQIIHRDIKPENILISKNLELKIGDFGLALSINDSLVTSQFHIVGTPTYMSPEQIRGDKLTSKSDLFSAGIVAYEFFTGTNPFLGKDVNDTLNKIMSFDEDKLINLCSALPPDVQNLIMVLLHNDPKERIEDAHKVVEILTNKTFINKSTSLGKKKNKTAYIILSLFVLLLVVFFLIKQYNNPGDSKIVSQTGNDTILINKIADKGKIGSIAPTDIKKEEIKPGLTAAIPIDKKDQADKQEKIIQIPAIKKTGSFYVECLPWAYVYIDSIKMDVTPLKNNLVLSEGEHFIQLIHPNFPIYSKKIRINANGYTDLKINLDTLFAFLDCKVNPWCEIYVDGILKGQTPLQYPIKVMPGVHHVLLENSEFEPKGYDVKTSQGQTFTITYTFRKVN
ncbi:MAG: serine/threonine protein kinase [Ignavibacteriaceae bacterium]|nr:serine/threonine protein kinase [Ignavibacteriaceae bacterium]